MEEARRTNIEKTVEVAKPEKSVAKSNIRNDKTSVITEEKEEEEKEEEEEEKTPKEPENESEIEKEMKNDNEREENLPDEPDLNETDLGHRDDDEEDGVTFIRSKAISTRSRTLTLPDDADSDDFVEKMKRDAIDVSLT